MYHNDNYEDLKNKIIFNKIKRMNRTEAFNMLLIIM